MKNLTLALFFILTCHFYAKAQRLAYVDSEFILKHIPDYKSAQKQLDNQSSVWQKEIDTKFREIEKMYQTYQADQVLLSAEMKKRRENEIIDKEKAAKDFQKLKFGYEGDLFKERVKLIKPIQDKVAAAIKEYAETEDLDMIFDKSAGVTLLFGRNTYDKSNDIITKLGYKTGSAR
ncbi:MAG: OmpH family outer membrane protein [Sphingobacteriales bacterium]|nr:MAG: OmpH family outer membrane protein [Sphingobacteriales bacterium]TAF82694.1 MAG: OmpH family outer membrane protein [Sphingobacteriales bacterium]